MIQTVLKRDGRVVGYNEEKVKAAIRKAMLATEAGEDEALIQRIADRIGQRGRSQMSVEEIQDQVELELMKSPARRSHAATSTTATSAAWHAGPRRVTCSWRSSMPRTTTSRARTPT